VGPLAIELAPELSAKLHPAHRQGGLIAARLVAFRRSQPLKPDWQPTHLDGVAVPDVGDLRDERPASAALRLGRRPHERHEQQAKQQEQSHLLCSPDAHNTLVRAGYDVFSADVDDRGIDFVLRTDSDPPRYHDVQVKPLSHRTRTGSRTAD